MKIGFANMYFEALILKLLQCEGKNFSRRKQCYKCAKDKTPGAKIVPVVK